MPRLSVIIPIYNSQNTLKKCVDSVLAQSFTDMEIILVDDGSEDDSLKICREYEQQDKRIVVFHKENEGLVAARKSGLSIAKGEYIGFVDSDDFIDSTMYADLMVEADKNESDIVAGGVILDYPQYSKECYSLLPVGFYAREDLQTKIIPKMIVYSGFVNYGLIPGVVVKVFKKELLEKALPNVPNVIKIGEDLAITSYAVLQAKSLSIVQSAAYHYVQGDASMIRAFSEKRFTDICNLYGCISKIENASYQKQVNLYMAYLLWLVLAELVKKSGYSRKQKIRTAKQFLTHETSRHVLKNANVSGLGLKDKLKVFLMRHRMVRTLMGII